MRITPYVLGTCRRWIAMWLLAVGLTPFVGSAAQGQQPVSQPSSSVRLAVPSPGSAEATIAHNRGLVERATSTEMDEMRQQLKQAQAQIEELRAQINAMRSLFGGRLETAQQASTEPRKDQTSNLEAPMHNSAASQAPVKQNQTVDELIAPKNKGGQFSGAEGLYKADRVKIGGYVDFRYITRGIDEGFEIRSNVDEENPGQTDRTNFKRNGFISPRAVLGIAAAITPRLLFNSEIEFEFAGKETEIEQMYLEYRLNRQFNLRGGVVVPPLGRFNLFHDSNLQDLAARPLVSTFVIPSTYKDAGIGALGEIRLGNQARLNYEGYVVNGLRSDEGGEFAREVGLFESKGNNRFFDNNSQKAIVGRLMFSPLLGVELAASGYRGKHDNQGQHNLSIWAFDWKVAHRGFQVIGEFARASVQRPPEDEAELAAKQLLLSLPEGDYTNTFDFLDTSINEPLFDRPARSLGGFYAEARYRFRPRWLASHFEAEDASIAPVFRYDQVNLDRSFPNFKFPLNIRRVSFGISMRPTEAASINLAYHLDRKPDILLRLPDGRPFPPYFTNLGIKSFSLGLVWAF
jgi:hypothetical protein